MMLKAWLEGDEADLQVLTRLLPEGDIRVVHDPDEDAYYLTAPDIDNPPSGTAFYEVATKLIRRANGLGPLSDPAFRPVSLSGKYGDGESKHQVISVPSITCHARMGTPTVTVTRPDGTVVPNPPSPWPKRFALAESNRDVAQVLEIHHGPPLGWIELWKVYEIIRESIRPGTIVGLGWVTQADLDSFKESANREDVSGSEARHARRPGQPQHRKMPLDEGRSVFSALVTKWLDWLGKT
jgi:hypothetical protein